MPLGGWDGCPGCDGVEEGAAGAESDDVEEGLADAGCDGVEEALAAEVTAFDWAPPPPHADIKVEAAIKHTNSVKRRRSRPDCFIVTLGPTGGLLGIIRDRGERRLVTA